MDLLNQLDNGTLAPIVGLILTIVWAWFKSKGIALPALPGTSPAEKVRVVQDLALDADNAVAKITYVEVSK